jgi:putative flippase GtrA
MRLSHQVSKFAVVGGIATMVHAAVYAGFAGVMQTNPLLATVLAYLTAFAISFGGHLYWTFAEPHARQRPLFRPLVRFFLISLAGFSLNTLAVFGVTELMKAPPLLAIIPMILVTPVLTFFLSRRWAFAS